MKQLPIASSDSLILNLLQGLSHDYNINNTEELLNIIRKSINDIVKKPNKLHGIRIEKMFGYIVAMLGQCRFIKQEDIGFSYVTTDVKIPDYHLILNDGRELFVEVKNCHKVNKAIVKLTESYVCKMLNYPDVNLDNFKIAIYWSRRRLWTLTALSEFDKKDNKYTLKMEEAIVKNEMGLLGDVYFMADAPLKIVFITDLSKTNVIDSSGIGDFTIKDIQTYTGNGLVDKDTNEGRVIFDLIIYGLNGSWKEKNYVELKDNKIEKIIFEYIPYNENQTQALVGSLSGVITNKYNLITVKDGIINKLQANYEKSLFDFYLKIQAEQLHHLMILKQKIIN